jgi:hypothetical protein
MARKKRDVSSCDFFAQFSPNYIFISLVYLTLDDMAVRSKLQFYNKHYKLKFIYRLFSSTIKVYVLFNSIKKNTVTTLIVVFGKNLPISVCLYKSFSKIFLRIQKKNVYPVHKPAAVDYIMFNFGYFYSIM